METDKIRKAVFDKAKEEAKKIISEAEVKAGEAIEKAKLQKEQKFEAEKKKIISEARREAAKITAQASLKSRQEILKVKEAVINEIIKKAEENLSRRGDDKDIFLRLIEETLDALKSEDKVRLLVSHKDLDIARKVVAENGSLKEKIAEVTGIDCIGGVMIETTNGMVSINNTFDTRLEMLMPKILPEIGKNLFGVDEN